MRNLALYFGVYFLSAELDKWMKIINFDHINILPAVMGINAFFAIQIVLNYLKRQEVNAKLRLKKKTDADIEGGLAGMMSSTGLSTIFNALT